MKPDLPKLFPELKSINSGQLDASNTVFGHAERVMRAVENAVSALDDAESFTAYLEELGRRHKVRALKPDYLEVSFFQLSPLLINCYFEYLILNSVHHFSSLHIFYSNTRTFG